VQTKKDEYEHFMNNKRTIFASRMKPRWAPASTHGKEMNDLISDPNYLFKKSLLPLDEQALQEGAFKRTTRACDQFKQETASVI
jgi:acyl transferase domain-containing protein